MRIPLGKPIAMIGLVLEANMVLGFGFGEKVLTIMKSSRQGQHVGRKMVTQKNKSAVGTK